ncbi:MurR/RpiR family transcriptional regulator [Ruegeria sp.]|uniref:MurR/RpiR family transcriptional regulator n=1 Tax=Ruegeria sp. TaxID=1879320 RepID=UPI00230E9678|nr:MurR/RpiR family transcriptional regulator [Ruegeria sp.]MDA7966844.1 MurR/RpiR family transcriptional regulator [Ruegeria sp.]
MSKHDPDRSARERLASCSNLSGAESAIALWCQDNIADLPFVSAARVAEGAGVSEMTVVRFVRRLGYENFKALKHSLAMELRAEQSVPASDTTHRFAIPEGTTTELAQQMKLEIDAVMSVYELAQTQVWVNAIDTVCQAEHVNVTGFQASKGLALDFATRLKYARPGVRFAEGISGNWSEVFAEDPERSCLVLVDTAAYAQTSFRIAELCLRRNVPLIMVTDKFSRWPRKYTPHVLSVATNIGTYWDSTSGLSALLGLFLNGVTAHIGQPALDRKQGMDELGAHFNAYSYEPDLQSRPVRNKKDSKND